MKRERRLLKLLPMIFFIVSMENLLGQSGPSFQPPKVIPPSPTASALGKYGDVPVSLFSGLPNISIPLYELSSKELSVPVSLSYHASGVKVEDIASWVGTGWSLNAGGAITRSVRGRADEDYGRLTAGPPTPQTDIFNLYLYATNAKDAEPDVYYYNFNGRSGQLMYDESGTFYSTSAEKIKFEKTVKTAPNQEWILVDEQGTRYLFNSVENTSSNGGTANITAWYLTRIFSADLSDTIKFNYVNKDELYYRPNSQTLTWHNTPGDWEEAFVPGFQPEYNNSTYTNGLSILSEISGKKGKIVFETTATRQDIVGGRALDKIKVYDKAGLLKRTYQFTYASYQTRLFLLSVYEIAPDLTQKPPHKFFYNDPNGLPPTNSKGQDFWVYANGANLNAHLIPNFSTEFFITDLFGSQFPSNFTPSNRTVNETFLKKGMLTRVEYPTGGATEFDFEKHTFLNGTAEFDVEDIMPLSTINDGTATSSPFTLGGPNIFIDITFSDFREPFNYPRPVVFLEELVGGNWTNVQGQTCIWQIPYPALNNVVMRQSIGLEENHTYRLRIATEGCPLPPCNTPPANAYTTSAKVTYFDNNHQYVSSGGGLRIKEIRDYAVSGGAPTNIRTYEYDSGLLVAIPVFKDHFYRRICDVVHQGGQAGGTCATMSLINCYSASSQSLVNLGTSQGSHVVYKKVREKYGATGENGYADSWFDLTGLSFNGNFTIPVKPFKPAENVDYRQGKLLRQIKYNASGDKLEYIKNTYKNIDLASPNYHTVQGVRIMQDVYLSYYDFTSYLDNIGMFVMDGYFVTSRFVYQDSAIQTTYHKNGSVWNPVTNVTRLFYENPAHIQLTRSTTADSEGNTIETKYWYPHDYGSVENVGTLRTNNILALPIKEETTRNALIISGKVSRFKDYGKPTEIWQYESLSPQTPPTHSLTNLIPSGYVKKADIDYDATTKKINKVQLVNNLNTAYLWGYNNTLPIAEVKNANVADVAATSFEADGKGNWTYSGGAYSDIPVKSGKYYYRLMNGSITKSLAAGKYKLEYWGKGTVNLSGGTITTIRTSPADANGWIFYEKEVTVGSTTTFTLSGISGAFIDELRIYPSTAQVSSYTYDVVNGMTSMTDPNNVITYFEYDAFGRLRLAKDQYGNIVKAYDYHYKGF